MSESTGDAQTIAELGELLKLTKEEHRATGLQEIKRLRDQIIFLEAENRELRKEDRLRVNAHNALVYNLNITEARCAELKAKIRKLKKKRRS